MKNFLFIALIITFTASTGFSQKGTKRRMPAKTKIPVVERAVPVEADEPPPSVPKDYPPPAMKSREIKQKISSDILKERTIGEWGAASIRIPQDLIETNNLTKKDVNDKVSWTTFSRSWKLPEAGFLEGLEVDLTIKIWDNEIKEIIPELRPDLATPEHLVLVSLLGDLNSKNTPGSFVKEARAMDISNLNGSYFRAVEPSNANRLLIGWGTYRYYKGKPQNITLTISSATDELEKALKILQSLKIETAT